MWPRGRIRPFLRLGTHRTGGAVDTGDMDAVPDAVLDHWHQKPLVVDIATQPQQYSQQSWPPPTPPEERLPASCRRTSPVFSPDIADDAAGEAPASTTVRFNDRPLVFGSSPVAIRGRNLGSSASISSSNSRSLAEAQHRVPSRAVQWMAAATLQRAYRRRRAGRIAAAGARTGRNLAVRPSTSAHDVSLRTGAALARQREDRRAAALRAVARDREPAASQLGRSCSAEALVRSSSTAPLTGCSSRTLVEAHFDSGPLGLRVAEYVRPGREGARIRVEEIQPGSAAAAVPDLRVGMSLLQINGAEVRYAGYKSVPRASSRTTSGSGGGGGGGAEAQWFATVVERMAQRPLSLIFVAEQPSATPTHSDRTLSASFSAEEIPAQHRQGQGQWQGLSPLSTASTGMSPRPPPPSPQISTSMAPESHSARAPPIDAQPAHHIRRKRQGGRPAGCCAARPVASAVD
jgi:hypothetical protein